MTISSDWLEDCCASAALERTAQAEVEMLINSECLKLNI
jgi:hypothetical protein